ncbi:MAG TPA: EF-P lysine aminoacylase EpmA [Candidatus Competibacteraceae bacterium]|nr:EF-P lysine aminoacylase GenX [Candidatus Competibacteraceae bacterium]MCP5132917.1 EF-P lysine aminoacylase GenX [Gammaproteobacteria bacterium]HPF59283.1 EF-P lysine aminoacylase EpmA [Candidatus Competibacteraceae bacterium]HRY18944.1 EF-P lysine aminoacylase EpmA [Candidatus Competibacteraceae bacterium]
MAPPTPLPILRLRAELLARTRAFFAARDVLEVETPMLSAAATTDPHLASFATQYSGPGSCHGQPFYLHTSPEFPMKRLLAAGSGCIYQIARVFRDGEAGRRHNPEFTLLEWYRVGFDHHQLMAEAAELASVLLADRVPLAKPEWRSYRELFTPLGLDPHRVTVAGLAACAERCGVPVPPGMPLEDTDPWLDLLLTHCIEPHLGQGRLCFVYDYPASQAALARLRPGDPPVGERFELYLNGIELANGFHELGDAVEQRRRFEAENAVRRAQGLPVMPIDENLLAALETGLPDCAGVALGFDRLVMLAAGRNSLAEVLAFPFEQA